MTSGADRTVDDLEAGQTRIETALVELTKTVNRKFDELGERFVPRQELTVSFDNIKDHQRAQDERLFLLESGRQVDRQTFESRVQNAKVVALSMAGAILTALALIVTHWK